MRRPTFLFIATVLLIVLGWSAATGCAAVSDVPVDTASLLDELIDLKGLSLSPEPAFTCRQFSSYDRKSLSPEEEWFANYDRGEFLRAEDVADRTEYVMMDAAGPGAVVRIWSANPRGTLRIYLDGASKPVVEAEMKAFLGGETPGFPTPITHTASRGWNSYFPIPYAKHCKITSDADDFYYQINYRTYGAQTEVATFTPDVIEQLADKIAELARRLELVVNDPAALAGCWKADKTVEHPFQVSLAPGERGHLQVLTGPRAVARLELQVEGQDLSAALRGLALSGVFDGYRTISTPLGDFFGTAPGLNPYGSLPLGVSQEGLLWSSWWMPFQEKAAFFVDNTTGQQVTLRGRILSASAPWTERSMHFHAKWRIDKKISTRPMRDWNYLDTSGQGVFVGDALYVANPVKTWWGEGDEKIYVDGETFPSLFGTGTEDYYGYAWGSPELFTNAYHTQSRCDGPGVYGHTALTRWHIMDKIPYRKSLRFDMEIWHWAEVDMDYAVVSYWYAKPGGRDGFPPAGTEPDDLILDLIPPYRVFKIEGVIEGEEMEVLSRGGITEKQAAHDDYSGEAQLWWREAAPGDTLVLAFECEEAGPYHVAVVLTKAEDYGIHQLAINDLSAGEPFDLYKSGAWGNTEEIDLGVFELQKGRNLFTATIVGSNEEAIPKHMFGMDYIRLFR